MRHFTASDGARIAYRDQGTGRPFVMLHGLMAHGAFFRAQDELADQYRLIAVDLRGHGASAATAPLTVERLARDVTELVEALAIEDAVGIGWSLGASVLWKVLTGPSRDRFAAAVVVDMTARVQNCDGWSLGLSPEACDARTAAMAGDFETFAMAAGQAIFSQPIDPVRQDVADWASFEFARNDPATIATLWQSLVGEDFRPLLPGIDQPALIIHGRHSQLYEAATAEYLARVLPNAREIEFERSGHAPQLEQPDLFNAIIRNFAARLSRAPAPKTQSI